MTNNWQRMIRKIDLIKRGHERLFVATRFEARGSLPSRGVYIENHAIFKACFSKWSFSHAKQWHTFTNRRMIGNETLCQNNVVLTLVISVNNYLAGASKFGTRNVIANQAHGGLAIPWILLPTKCGHRREMFLQTELPHRKVKLGADKRQDTRCLALRQLRSFV